MFKFGFDLDLEDTDEAPADSIPNSTEVCDDQDFESGNRPSFVVSTVEDLITNLPPLISHSPLRIPLSDDESFTLIRRDLFDTRFQLISESPTAETSADLNFIDAPSDLVPGVYEGGLKTWECSADLAAYLDSANVTIADSTYRILEVGCGTAVPSLFLLRKLFYTDPANCSTETPRTTIHLQDYNSIVLELVTLPNIVLTWYVSPASESYRSHQDPPLPEASVSEPGELPLTSELLSAFVESLRERHIELTFISGSWNDTDVWIRQRQLAYDLVLTSETIYRPSSLPGLISLLHSASTIREAVQNNDAPSGELAHLSLHSARHPMSTLCLVAAKVIYFGVGGGVDGFGLAVREEGGQPKTVFERKAGVTRRIIQVVWNQVESG